MNYAKEIFNAFTSIWSVALYLALITSSVFSMIVNNYFVGDDFTWLRWVADCKKVASSQVPAMCQPLAHTILDFFTSANGFFYRPGTKVYFYIMYAFFALNNDFYHIVSIALNFLVGLLVYILSLKLLKNKLFAFIAALFFILFSIHFEAVYWISSVGFLISAFCMLFSLVTYIYWKEKKYWVLLVFSVLAAFTGSFFHELGIITPFIIVLYDLCFAFKSNFYKKIKSGLHFLPFFLIIPIYLLMRFLAQSHWSGGDYSYNILKLPFNFIGNTIGYIGMTLLGPSFQDTATALRAIAKGNVSHVVVGVILDV
jgi:hypothetical protein